MRVLSVEKQRSVEEQILLHFIISDKFCHSILPVFKPEYIQIDTYQTICKWVLNYYENHKKAPKNNIKKIWQVEKTRLTDEDASIFNSILSRLNIDSESEETSNIEYAIETASAYFRKRDLVLSIDTMQEYVDRDMLDEAELIRYQIGARIESAETGSKTFTIEAVEECFDDNLTGETFGFNGYMSNIVGKIERGHFIAFMGPPKRGKTTWMVECASQALMSNMKVAFFSFEMRRRRINQRFYQRFGNLLLPSYYLKDKIYEYPVADCKHNQHGTCDKKIRRNAFQLMGPSDDMPELSDANPDYRPCIACYEEPKLMSEFSLTTWFERIERPLINISTAQQVTKAFKMKENNLRVIFYPRGTKSLDDIIQKLELLAHVENFHPDLVIIDYLDITKIGGKSRDDRHNLNAVWEKADGYSTDKNIVLISATQAGRASSSRKSLVVEDISEEWRKIAHLDKLIAINQTKDEKRRKIQRIGLLANRDDDFDTNDQALCLQNMSACQPCIDSYRMVTEEE